MLKVMKKVLIVILLLISTIKLFSPSKILATACCSGDYRPAFCSITDERGYCVLKNADVFSACANATIRVTCKTNEKCNVNSNVCESVNAFDPTCPGGCVQGWGGDPNKCYETIPRGNPLGLGLTDTNTPCLSSGGQKNICQDVTTKYDSNPKSATYQKCVRFVETPWDLNATTCQGTEGINTAIGCVPTGKPEKFVEFLYKWAFGAAAGIITIMVILTGYKVLTSGGNPEQLQSAKENIVSIFSGLILIAFSLVLLQAVGANILQLPTF